jgi:cystathionine beta-lyase/cystathionine gamma-synthase
VTWAGRCGPTATFGPRHGPGGGPDVFLTAFALFTLAGVESLIEHPARMTHASAAGSPLEVPSDLIRLSVGIEDPRDLLADLFQALS